MPEITDCLTTAEAAKLLGYSKSRVDQLVRNGTLKIAGTIGQVRLLARADVEALAAKGKPKPGPKPKKKRKGVKK